MYVPTLGKNKLENMYVLYRTNNIAPWAINTKTITYLSCFNLC
jgi:hypothetical protein